MQIKIADPKLTLDAVIVSATKSTNLRNVSYDQNGLKTRNVFRDDAESVYLKKLFERIV
ncbi:hypothetical protein [Nitrosomonas aestuarii]|uniref:hypothetical protein n=1 Tax=Nitrosomonas aestuarii TaxID=52441 RepID=UPI000D4E7445|nr:hypothetical protein [Nitrosomonas aestuarii]PTN12900.1 hypothetical protein C8R11_102178 [Nitrosomonas aestuarii]